MRTFLLKRGGWPKCMIQLSRAPMRKMTSASRKAWLRAAPTDNGWLSSTTPLPSGDARNGSWVRSMNARTSSSARDQAMPLPTMTSGRSADSESFQRRLDIPGHRLHPGRIGDRGRLNDVRVLDFLADNVVRHVQIDRSRTTVDRGAHGLFDIERDTPGMLDRMGELAIGRGELDLVLLLERAHAVLIDGRGAADQDHRPAVLLGIGKTGERMDDAGARDNVRQAPGRPVR